MMRRRGFVLPEVMTALALTGIIAAALFAVCRSQTRLATHIVDQAARADALRVADMILGAETRALASADIHAVDSDSLAVRIFRGTAVVCSHRQDIAHVRYRGIRRPDPDKDSILIADTEGVLALSAATTVATTCATGDGEIDLELRVSGSPLMPGTPLLVFETGSYHFSTRALRFRRGIEGRQPITEEVFDDAATGFFELGPAYLARATLRTPRREPAAREQTAVAFPSLNR